jgi:hypothetical protein
MNDYYRTVREEYKNKLAGVFNQTIIRQASEGQGVSVEEKLALIDRAESPEVQLAHFVASKHDADEAPKVLKAFAQRREGFLLDPTHLEDRRREETLRKNERI